MNNYIYVVFIRSNTKAGSVIRKLTGWKYSHVSISFDENKDEFENYYDLTICVTSASDYDNLNDEYDKESDERDAQDIVNEQGNDSSSSQENNQQEKNPDSYPEENEDREDTFDGNYFIKGGFIAAPKIRNIN